MNRNVNPIVVVVVVLALLAAIGGVYAYLTPARYTAGAGSEDIPPRQPGDDKPAPAPPEAGPAPGTMGR